MQHSDRESQMNNEDNEVIRKHSHPLLPCKYQAWRVVTGECGTPGLEMGYRGSWSPSHG